MKQTRPDLVCEISDKELGLIGFLVVDATINNVSWGGVRMLPDITLEEMIGLARTMTMKYAFLGIEMGGAKSGVIVPPPGSERRKEILRAFGRRLSPLLRSNYYMPGIDMGASVDDLQEIAEGAGLKINFTNWKDVSHIYTSWTLVAFTREMLRKMGVNFSDCKVAIEGFGKVGSYTAELFSEEGAQVVAVSTRRGAVYNEKGLHVEELLELKERAGDDEVNLYKDAEKIPLNKIFSLPVDILIPCARSLSINSSNVNQIKAKVICPGANVPMTEEIEEILFEKGVLCFPDFVANSGGVLGSIMRSTVKDKEIRRLIDTEFGKRVEDLIDLSNRRNVSLGRTARDIVERKFDEMKERCEGRSLKDKLVNRARWASPAILKKAFAVKRFTKMLRS